jgi:hypothetical protein
VLPLVNLSKSFGDIRANAAAAASPRSFTVVLHKYIGVIFLKRTGQEAAEVTASHQS